LKHVIQNIQQQIKDGIFSNEASVIRGIINPILQELNWPINDVRIVRPEYTLENRRVDIALFHNNQPHIFIEAKKIGAADGAERQLFEYAFHAGVPILILTDGPTWHFFLTAGLGNYGQRKVSRLDLIEYEDLDQLSSKFKEYLDYNKVISGQAQKCLESDYRSRIRELEIVQTLPKAWEKILDDKDELLFEIIANKVEELCNYKPSSNAVFEFLTNIRHPHLEIKQQPPVSVVSPESLSKVRIKPSGSLGFTRILSCSFGGINPGNRWANLINTGINLAVGAGFTIEDLRRNTTLNLIQGEEHERGYKFIPQAKLSYQGMDANKTWDNALKIAQLIKKKIFVEFEWTYNPNAVFRGKKEILFWEP
jgi:Arc/MetJ-type ribon-helix-helix transcriptional regulator